ncbi:hypothetical protein F4859DRAFT_364021 [Xylaria cf. heliscus]|nr:hypothetical protein F4859DRAFT_364021 [Xylaria cf. heliscus]
MATTPKRSPTPERTAGEDPDTAAARKELRQTAISEKPSLSAMAADNRASPSDDAPAAAKDLMLSPKKKRAHDEVDEPKDTATDADTDGDVSPIGANGSASLSRTDRSEPEKKRPRDISSELKAPPTIGAAKSLLSSKTTTAKASFAQASSAKNDDSNSDKVHSIGTKNGQIPAKKPSTTTASAFQTSTLSGFANQPSPFLQASTGQKPLSSFASPSSTQTSFSTLTSSTTTIFSAGGSSSTSSPFSQFGPASSPFGGIGGFSGTPFAAPGGSLTSNKPAKPFGAPASDKDDESDEDADSNADGNDGDDAANQDDGDDDGAATGATADGGKPKLQPVAANDDEASIIQARGKLYHLDKTANVWKERGAGILKLMVPKECAVSGDNPNTGLPGSFDPTALKDSESKIIRLVMRQDATHRVILNTTLLPNMEFREKSGLKATSVLFTAIEDDGPVSITLRVCESQFTLDSGNS